jgi:NAD(P)-dependent dehydrogenase (short-subunit alcohol dehydrogenase family)
MMGDSGPVRFDGRVALVTGAGVGLGRAHAMQLAGRGAKVVVNDLGGSLTGHGVSQSVADQVVAEIRAAGGEAVANYDSVADRAGAEAMVRTALDTFGRIDIVVNNAGILRDKSFAKMDLDDFELVVKVHLFGTVYVTKAAWPHMLAQKYGRIVFTSSGAGLANGFGQSNYATAKTALIGLMNNLRNEGAKSGIKVNIISPVAATRMTASSGRPDISSDALAPEKVSAAVAWFCSEGCDVTGKIIAAGGGYFAPVQLMRGRGMIVATDHVPTVDEFAEVADKIFDYHGAVPYERTLDPDTKAILGITT